MSREDHVKKTLKNLSHRLTPNARVVGFACINDVDGCTDNFTKVNINSIPNIGYVSIEEALTLFHDWNNPRDELNTEDIFNTKKVNKFKDQIGDFEHENKKLKRELEKLKNDNRINMLELQLMQAKQSQQMQPMPQMHQMSTRVYPQNYPNYNNVSLEDYDTQKQVYTNSHTNTSEDYRNFIGNISGSHVSDNEQVSYRNDKKRKYDY